MLWQTLFMLNLKPGNDTFPKSSQVLIPCPRLQQVRPPIGLQRVGAKIKPSLDSWSETSISRTSYWSYRELGPKSSQVLIRGPKLQQVGPPIGPIERLGQNQVKSWFLVRDFNKSDPPYWPNQIVGAKSNHALIIIWNVDDSNQLLRMGN